MSLFIGRIEVGPPLQWQEPWGDPVTSLGGAVIPAPRQAPRHQVAIATIAGDSMIDSLAIRFRLRRQLRAVLNNTALKLQGYVYVQSTDDPEMNGWYVPDFGQLADYDGSSGLATGLWKLENVVWLESGHRRTHREARNIWMRDLRSGLNWRDTLRWIYSSDFSGLSALQLSVLPSGATFAKLTVNSQGVPTVALPTGRDGGIAQLAVGLSDLQTIAFERPESAINLSDVVVYDRRGLISGPFYNPTVLADNPTSYWRLDETVGTTASDSTGPNNLTYTGGFTLNQTGALTGGSDNDAAVLFNGTTGYAIDASPSGLPSGSSAFTVEGWAKTTSGASNQTIFCYTTNTVTNGIWLTFSGTSLIAWVGGTSMTVTSVISTNKWFHVVLAFDGTTIRLFLNGVSVGTPVNVSTPVGAPSTASVAIGRRTDSASGFFNGTLDEVAVYNYCFTATQVSDHYASGTSYDGGNQWEEVEGSDYPWSWTESGGVNDMPVVSNGLIRIRLDTTGPTIGFRTDIWEPAGAANGGPGWVEQGKMLVQRIGDTTGLCDTFVSANVYDYTPDRAIVKCVLSRAADTYSFEEIYITVTRGDQGCSFEAYPALKQAGGQSDVAFRWFPALNTGVADYNTSILKVDTQTLPPAVGSAAYAASASSGTGQQVLATQVVGASNFTNSENYAALIRCSTGYKTINPYMTVFTVIQAANADAACGNTTSAYGTNESHAAINSQNGAGYLQCNVDFAPTTADQVMEAEDMTLGAGTTAGGDPLASGSACAQTASITSGNVMVSRANWPNSFQAKYHIFIRVKTTAAQMSARAVTTGGGGTTGSTATLAGAATPTYAWLDLGEVTAVNGTLQIQAWISSGSGIIELDRVEAVMVEDRTRSSNIYIGARDQAQAQLFDARQLGAVVAR